MAVPRNRLSNARKNIRRSHHAQKPKQLIKCPSCQEFKVPHRICPACGVYRGRNVISKVEES